MAFSDVVKGMAGSKMALECFQREHVVSLLHEQQLCACTRVTEVGVLILNHSLLAPDLERDLYKLSSVYSCQECI